MFGLIQPAQKQKTDISLFTGSFIVFWLLKNLHWLSVQRYKNNNLPLLPRQTWWLQYQSWNLNHRQDGEEAGRLERGVFSPVYHTADNVALNRGSLHCFAPQNYRGQTHTQVRVRLNNREKETEIRPRALWECGSGSQLLKSSTFDILATEKKPTTSLKFSVAPREITAVTWSRSLQAELLKFLQYKVKIKVKGQSSFL